MENAVNASTAGGSGQIVVAGAGYAGLHVALRLTAKLRNNSAVELTLVDRHDYHQALTELPRVAGGTRAADAVRIPLQDTLSERVRFVQAEINGFDLDGRRLLTGAGPIGWTRLVLARGRRPRAAAPPGDRGGRRRRRHRGRAGRRAGRGAARGGRRPRPGGRPARRAAGRGRPHHPGRLLAAA